MEARLTHLRPRSVRFELCAPDQVIQLSEVLDEFTIRGPSRCIFRGKATVTAMMNHGPVTAYEAVLADGGSLDVCTAADQHSLRGAFESFIGNWSKFCRVTSEYKEAVIDLASFLGDLRIWLDEVEIGLHPLDMVEKEQTEERIVRSLLEPASAVIGNFFQDFEIAAAKVPAELLPTHYAFCRRELHPLLMASPFMHRIFAKPLGYAGDYQMVNMILQDPCAGRSLFAKLLNVFILKQAPAVAHRNRIQHLVERLVSETARCQRPGRPCRVYNIGCGPVGEVQQFIAKHAIAANSEFVLVDGNQETLDFALHAVRSLGEQHGRPPRVHSRKQTVQQLLKQKGKPVLNGAQFDFIYSAGLFDYLNDKVCRLLIEQCYSWLAPGGLLLITNVDSSNPIRNIMEHVYEWFLVYRDGRDLEKLAAGLPDGPDISVTADLTSSNLFLEIRKPPAM